MEREENGEPEPPKTQKPDALKEKLKKEGNQASQDSRNVDQNYKREKDLVERKSESLTDQLDNEFESGSRYDKKTE